MHLRGPMNVSQLAVYQLPDEMRSMQRRNVVPFYNRRLARRDHALGAQMPIESEHPSATMEKPMPVTSTACNSRTAPTTVTMKGCRSDTVATVQPLHNITNLGPPLPCQLTPILSCPTTSVSGMEGPCERISSASRSTRLPASKASALSTERKGCRLNTARVRRASSDWNRVGYYTSTAPAQATGLSFLANLGDPQKSGTFD